MQTEIENLKAKKNLFNNAKSAIDSFDRKALRRSKSDERKLAAEIEAMKTNFFSSHQSDEYEKGIKILQENEKQLVNHRSISKSLQGKFDSLSKTYDSAEQELNEARKLVEE